MTPSSEKLETVELEVLFGILIELMILLSTVGWEERAEQALWPRTTKNKKQKHKINNKQNQISDTFAVPVAAPDRNNV